MENKFRKDGTVAVVIFEGELRLLSELDAGEDITSPEDYDLDELYENDPDDITYEEDESEDMASGYNDMDYNEDTNDGHNDNYNSQIEDMDYYEDDYHGNRGCYDNGNHHDSYENYDEDTYYNGRCDDGYADYYQGYHKEKKNKKKRATNKPAILNTACPIIYVNYEDFYTGSNAEPRSKDIFVAEKAEKLRDMIASDISQEEIDRLTNYLIYVCMPEICSTAAFIACVMVRNGSYNNFDSYKTDAIEQLVLYLKENIHEYNNPTFVARYKEDHKDLFSDDTDDSYEETDNTEKSLNDKAKLPTIHTFLNRKVHDIIEDQIYQQRGYDINAIRYLSRVEAVISRLADEWQVESNSISVNDVYTSQKKTNRFSKGHLTDLFNIRSVYNIETVVFSENEEYSGRFQGCSKLRNDNPYFEADNCQIIDAVRKFINSGLKDFQRYVFLRKCFTESDSRTGVNGRLATDNVLLSLLMHDPHYGSNYNYINGDNAGKRNVDEKTVHDIYNNTRTKIMDFIKNYARKNKVSREDVFGSLAFVLVDMADYY